MESFNINHVFIKNDLGVNYTTNFHHVMIHWHSDCETNPFLNYAEPAENFLFAKKKKKKSQTSVHSRVSNVRPYGFNLRLKNIFLFKLSVSVCSKKQTAEDLMHYSLHITAQIGN